MSSKISSLCVMGAGVLWGLLSIYSNALADAGISSLQVGFCRVFIAAVVLLVYIVIRFPQKLRIKPKDIWCFVGSGLVSLTLFNFSYFTTIANSQASVAVMLLYTSPIFVMLLSAFIFKERITWRKILALFCTLTGCVLVSGFLTGGQNAITPWVLATGIASGFFYGTYSIFGSFALRKYEPLTVTFYTFVFSAISSLPFADVTDIASSIAQSPSAIGWLLGIGIISTIGPYVLYTLGLNHMEAGRAAILATTEPLVGTLVGIFLFNEPHNIAKIAGLLLILASVVILNIKAKPCMPKNTSSSDTAAL